MTDKQLRLNRVFGEDERVLIEALDHGIADRTWKVCQTVHTSLK